MKKRVLSLVLIIIIMSMLFVMPVSAAVTYDRVKITYNYQVVDTLDGVDAKYLPGTGNTDTGDYCCAGYVSKYYKSVYDVKVWNLVTGSVPSASDGYFYEVDTPTRGDIVNHLNSSGSGHWMICKSYSNGKVTVIEQNWKWKTNGVTYAAKNRTFSKGDYKNVKYYRWSKKKDYPSRPKISSLTAENTTSITIKWDKADGAKKYDLYAKLSGGDYSRIAKDTTSTSYTHKNLTAGKRYWYYVVAKNDSGETKSVGKACYTKNTKPTLSKVADTPNALTIKWNKPTHAVSYTVRRRKYDSSSFEDVKTINNGDTTSWTDNSLTPGCQYYYYIHAECQLDDNTWKCNSESQNNYTLMKRVNVSSGGPYSINLSWSAPAGNRSIRYDIQRSTDNANYAVVATVDSNTRSYVDSGLVPNTRYYYRIVVMSDSYCTQTLVNSAVTDTLPDPSGITISANDISVTEGEVYKLDAVVYPDDANDKSVSWISDDSNIASVAGDGTVTAVKAGSTIIRARTANGYETVCNVTVTPKYIFVDLGDDFTAYIQYTVNGKYVTRIEDSDVRLWSENGSLNQIWHFIKQEDGSYKILSMAADDFNVLDVSGWGTTSGTNVGTYYDNDNIEENSISNQRWHIIQSETGYRLKAQCSECVLDVTGGGDAADGTNIQMHEYLSYGAQEFNINKIVLANGITVDKTNITLEMNETANINAIIQPDNATNKNVIWTTSDASVATVDNGTVTAKGLGNALITVATENGKYTASCNVSVVILPESISLNTKTLRLDSIGEKSKLTVTATPENSEQIITWESADTSVATVSDNGMVTAKGFGKTTVTAKTSNGKTAQCEVIVRELVIDKTSVSMNVGDSVTLSVETKPSISMVAVVGAKAITWNSSNRAVATVLPISTGYQAKVKANAPGQTVITAKTHDGFEVTCSVTVTDSTITEPPSLTIGDVNGDGEADIADAILVMKHDAGLNEINDKSKEAADVNRDGEIDIADAILIMKYDAGLITDLK